MYIPSSDNESLNNNSSDNKSMDSENGQNGNGNFVQIPITNSEQDTEPEMNFKMGWEWIIDPDPGPSVGPFLGEEMLLMEPEKNEPHHFFEALLKSKMWNYIAYETYRYTETRITKM